MANDYLTVKGQRSRYLGASGTYPSADGGPAVGNLDSDVFWQSVAARAGPPHPLVQPLRAGVHGRDAVHLDGHDGVRAG